MTVYVAARYTEQARARVVRATLVNRGFQVQSRWLYRGTTAQQDLDDLQRANVLVLVEALKPGGAGRYIEMGYALARRLPVLILGTPWWDVAFWQSLPSVTVYDTLPTLVGALAALAFRLEEGPIG